MDNIQSQPPFTFQASQQAAGWGLYFPCPDCGTYFKTRRVFADHLVADHWWDPLNAENYWTLGWVCG